MDLREREPWLRVVAVPAAPSDPGQAQRLDVAVVVDGPFRPVQVEAALADWTVRLNLGDPPGWVRRQRAADELGVSRKMVDKLRAQGRLHGVRDAIRNRAYVSRESLDAEIARRSVGSGR